MIPYRMSKETKVNPQLKESKIDRIRKLKIDGIGNTKWLEKYGTEHMKSGSILLFGGTSVTDFRLRVAQSHARSDLLPSYWSHGAILRKGRGGAWLLREVSLNPPKGFGEVPAMNACQDNTLKYYDNPKLWPNIAILSFPVDGKMVEEAISQVEASRGIIDLSALVVPWLAFVWGTGNAANPLLQEKGVPSSVLVETVMGIAGLELTPGLSSQSSCPEAIWQSVKWWHSFYKETGGTNASPRGVYAIRQESAAVEE